MLRSTRKLATTRLYLIAILLLTFSSCKDEKHERLARENVSRLKLQNEIIRQANLSLRAEFDKMIKDGSIKMIYQYESSIDNLYHKTDSFLTRIDSVKRRRSFTEGDSLFKYYSAVQKAIQELNADLNFIRGTEDKSQFISINETEFRSRYMNASDSLDVQNEILLLESDVLTNHRGVIEAILKNAIFGLGNQPIAIAMPEKLVYKKGEHLKIIAFLAKIDRITETIGTFEGQQKNSNGGFFEFSRKITERPGIYKVQLVIKSTQPGFENTYPTVVNFVVQ